jgi:glc operon protein GlcG
MKSLFNLKLHTILLFSAASITTQAQTTMPDYGTSINLSDAQRVVSAAQSEASKNKWSVVIAVVDAGGNLVLLQRLDGTQYGSVDVAQQKARSAAAFKRSTKVFQDAVTSGFMPVLNLSGAVSIEGGLPLVRDGKVIGAIGISGVQANEDGQIAAAGAKAIAP